MYCMARGDYKARLGKSAPGDIDFGHFCDADPMTYIEGLAPHVPPPKGGVVSAFPGMIKVKDKVFMSKVKGEFIENRADKTNLDVHAHPLDRSKKRSAKYCLCDNECYNVPLAPLDDLKDLYMKHNRALKNDNAKIKFI